MGMFDEIVWEQPLPDGRVPAGSVFQTKSLRRLMNRFTLTKEGRLIEHVVRYVMVERDPAKPAQLQPALRAVPIGDVDTNYHGDILITAIQAEGRWVEYVGRFTHGALEWAKPLEALSDADKRWVYYTD